jgi:hypothetical protein
LQHIIVRQAGHAALKAACSAHLPSIAFHGPTEPHRRSFCTPSEAGHSPSCSILMFPMCTMYLSFASQCAPHVPPG